MVFLARNQTSLIDDAYFCLAFTAQSTFDWQNLNQSVLIECSKCFISVQKQSFTPQVVQNTRTITDHTQIFNMLRSTIYSNIICSAFKGNCPAPKWNISHFHLEIKSIHKSKTQFAYKIANQANIEEKINKEKCDFSLFDRNKNSGNFPFNKIYFYYEWMAYV